MAIQQDKSKAKEALARQEAKAKSFGPRADIWNPENGDNRIRVMPPWTAEGINARQAWREIHVHWNVGPEGSERNYTCPAKTPDSPPNTPCPICQYVASLYNTNDPLDKERANDLKAKPRYYISLVAVDDPTYTKKDLEEWSASEFNKGRDCPFEVGDTKVQIYGAPTTVYNPLLALLVDESVDITSYTEGYNLILKKTGSGKNNTEYTLRPEFKSTPLKIVSKKPEDEWPINLEQIHFLAFAEPAELQEAVSSMTLGAPAGGNTAPLGSGPKSERPSLPPKGGAGDDRPAKSTPEPRASKPIVEEDKPPCFGDKQVHSADDAECIGGKKTDPDTKKISEYDPCPFFAECKKAIYGEELIPPRRGRRPAAAASGVSELEAQMRGQLNGGGK